MKICYNFASRERPQKFFDCLDNIRLMSDSDNYFVFAKLDNDCPNAGAYLSGLEAHPEVIPVWGQSESKVHAINRGLDAVPAFDILMNHSDDFWFTSYGYDDSVRENMNSLFPDLDGMLHYPDQVAKETLCTYQIVGRKYFERTGYIYHPDYKSVYCDNEETQRAKILGKYAYINENIFEHRHAIWGFGVKDLLLLRTEHPDVYSQDRDTFKRRKENNFYL